jgi:1,4-alpha-glucan branching enzyme
MLTKRKLENGKVEVTFSLSAIEGCQQLCLVGDFNEWSETAAPLKQAEDGTWSVTLELEPDRHYQYRYLADGQTWHNDWAADAYLPNPYGSGNSVVVTSGS